MIRMILAAAILGLPAGAWADDAQVIKENMDAARALENIASPVLIGNAKACGDQVAPYIGAEFLTKDGVAERYQDIMARDYGAQMHPTVTMVAKGSPADGVLQLRDVVTHLNGKALPEGADARFDFIDALKASYDPVKLTLKRGGAPKDVTITPAVACNVKVRIGGDGVDVADGAVTVGKDHIKRAESDALARDIKDKVLKITR